MKLRDPVLRTRKIRNSFEFYENGLDLIGKGQHEDKRDCLKVHDGISILIEEERLNST
jgi:hypothetical protein